MIDAITRFAEREPEIRAAILEGSRGAGAPIDDLSDYDVNLFCTAPDRFLASDAWMLEFGEVLIYQKESFPFYDAIIPTRLILYRGTPRIDFSFWPVELLADIAAGAKRREAYRNGFVVLVDKDGVAARIVRSPSRDELLQTIYDFWFEVCITAKYLRRGDLWRAKEIENGTVKSFLYRMMAWSHSDARALMAGSSLMTMFRGFNDLAREVCRRMGVAYPEAKERAVEEYLKTWSSRPL
jgi:aminoglycoside 6-adenylyltransferase